MSTAKPGEAGEAVQVAVLARRAHGAPSTVGRLEKVEAARVALDDALRRMAGDDFEDGSHTRVAPAWRLMERDAFQARQLARFEAMETEAREVAKRARKLRLLLLETHAAATGDRRDDSAARAAGGGDV